MFLLKEEQQEIHIQILPSKLFYLIHNYLSLYFGGEFKAVYGNVY